MLDLEKVSFANPTPFFSFPLQLFKIPISAQLLQENTSWMLSQEQPSPPGLAVPPARGLKEITRSPSFPTGGCQAGHITALSLISQPCMGARSRLVTFRRSLSIQGQGAVCRTGPPLLSLLHQGAEHTSRVMDKGYSVLRPLQITMAPAPWGSAPCPTGSKTTMLMGFPCAIQLNISLRHTNTQSPFPSPPKAGDANATRYLDSP